MGAQGCPEAAWLPSASVLSFHAPIILPRIRNAKHFTYRAAKRFL